MQQEIVIFSGYNLRAIIAFIRTLEKNTLSYSIIAKSEEDDIFKTNYVKNIIYIRQKTLLDINEITIAIKKIQSIKKCTKCMIAPSSEFLNRFILKNRVVFKNLNCCLPLVDEKLYLEISDKYSFVKLCKQHKIDTPIEYMRMEDVKLPCVLKPKKYFSSNNAIHRPKIIKNKKELELFIKKINREDFYLQEFVKGECIYLLYYFDKNKEVKKFSQENFVQQESGKSMLYAKASTFHNNDISLKFEKLFKDINFKGLVMVELKFINDRFIMIEANPRFWGPSQLFVDAGCNLFESLLKDYGFITQENQKEIITQAEYFWDDGISINLDSRNEVSFYNYSSSEFKKHLKKLLKIEVFNREDTIKLNKENQIQKVEKLKEMYSKTNKHSNYQIIASELEKFLANKDINVKSRNESIRLDYFLKNIQPEGKTILDIGGNTGYFSFEFLKHKASTVTYYEGNKEHAEFVKLASEVLGYEDKINIFGEYYNFDRNEKYHIILLLNVLHHLGDDFGDDSLSKEKALENIIQHLKNISKQTDILVFQLGFNWKGDRRLPLFKNGTKIELINFIKSNLRNEFEILNIGVAENINGEIIYNDVDDLNIQRDDSLGEFLNRPIFIMKSKQ